MATYTATIKLTVDEIKAIIRDHLGLDKDTKVVFVKTEVYDGDRMTGSEFTGAEIETKLPIKKEKLPVYRDVVRGGPNDR